MYMKVMDVIDFDRIFMTLSVKNARQPESLTQHLVKIRNISHKAFLPELAFFNLNSTIAKPSYIFFFKEEAR